MKVIFNLTERQVQKALILSGLNDADMDKINKVLPEYPDRFCESERYGRLCIFVLCNFCACLHW